ncbi:hypothetical protein P8918_13100 [Bacillus spizizenii]|nr:hypothetical protein [Bacillus spizizenii]MCY8890508.1 hypothetical protein [Bacillus spizizenii]MEC0841963.1 hypothetical protein [Bacillus spizizenii]
MSTSSLWGLDKDYKGSEEVEFSNSWWFSPIAWDILFQKYLPEKVTVQFGSRTNFMTATMFDKTIEGDLNEKINNSEVIEDRIVWELSMQQIFFTKDKELVVESIKHFLETNKEFAGDCGEHIYERFNEVADEISKLEEADHPYFVFKNTSVDDAVEYWFQKYDEEEEEYEEASLRDMDRHVAEFVFIEDGKITGFKSNMQYFDSDVA